MPLPVRSLPVVQNWSCHTCGQCCREYAVYITEAERAKIEKQGWVGRPEMGGLPPVVREGWIFGRYRLNHRADDSCVFLDEQGRCRIHAEFGEQEKPLACQLYPYVLIPAGDHWRIGVRYACPSATANKGRPVSVQRGELMRYAAELEHREHVPGRVIGFPKMRGRQRMSWDDVARIVKAIIAIIEYDGVSLEYRWRWALTVMEMCRGAKFDKVNGARLEGFLKVLGEGVRADIPNDPGVVPAPSGIGRVLFRICAAVYARRDSGAKRGAAQRSRIGLLAAGLRFARGAGNVPQVHALIPSTNFDQLEQPAGPMPVEADELLTRYYRVKLESYQFFGPIHFGYKFWDGLEALALTFPITMYLSRAFADRSRLEAIELALQIVDDNFGYNQLLGSVRQKLAVRALAYRGELPKLVARYAR